MEMNKGLKGLVNEEQVSLITVGCPIIGVFSKEKKNCWGEVLM